MLAVLLVLAFIIFYEHIMVGTAIVRIGYLGDNPNLHQVPASLVINGDFEIPNDWYWYEWKNYRMAVPVGHTEEVKTAENLRLFYDGKVLGVLANPPLRAIVDNKNEIAVSSYGNLSDLEYMRMIDEVKPSGAFRFQSIISRRSNLYFIMLKDHLTYGFNIQYLEKAGLVVREEFFVTDGVEVVTASIFIDGSLTMDVFFSDWDLEMRVQFYQSIQKVGSSVLGID